MKPIAKETKHQWRKESAKTTHCADESRHSTNFPGESFRHEFENRAIAVSQQKGAAKSADSEGNHGWPGHQQCEGNYTKEYNLKYAGAADFVGEPSAEGTRERRKDYKSGRSKAGVGGFESELIF